MALIKILDPTARPEDEAGAPTYDLGRSLQGVKVGLRLDRSWRSYFVVLDAWEKRLVEAGASVHRIVVSERVGEEGARLRNDLDEWAKLIDIGVVGLGN